MSTLNKLILVALVAAFSLSAMADGLGPQLGGGIGVVGARPTPTPPSCSNSFDLSKACNSQYLGFM